MASFGTTIQSYSRNVQEATPTPAGGRPETITLVEASLKHRVPLVARLNPSRSGLSGNLSVGISSRWRLAGGRSPRGGLRRIAMVPGCISAPEVVTTLCALFRKVTRTIVTRVTHEPSSQRDADGC